MFTTILVPLDGSALAERALRYAEVIAQGSGGRLVLTRVAQAHGVPGNTADLQRQVTAEARTDLEAIAERLRRQGQSVEVAVPAGAVAHALLEQARRSAADLIVMATHGRGGLGRLLFGSVADQIIRRADRPVLLIPARCSQDLPTDRTLRVLVPLDGSGHSEEIVNPASRLATALGARLLLLGAAPKAPPPLQAESLRAALLKVDLGETPSTRDKTEGHLERVADTLRGAGHTVEVHAVTGEPAPTILAEARAQGVDLIAMATHGRGGLDRLVLGSVTAAVLQHAGLPMLVVRPAALRASTTEAGTAAGVGNTA